jgi:hypothetical protein
VASRPGRSGARCGIDGEVGCRGGALIAGDDAGAGAACGRCSGEGGNDGDGTRPGSGWCVEGGGAGDVGGGDVEAAGGAAGAVGRGVVAIGDLDVGAGAAEGLGRVVETGGAGAEFRADFVLVGADGASSRMIAATVVNPTTMAAALHSITSRTERPRLGAGRG